MTYIFFKLAITILLGIVGGIYLRKLITWMEVIEYTLKEINKQLGGQNLPKSKL